MSRDYTEEYGDYTLGKETTAELVIMIGLSGSGKSTLTRSWVNKDKGQTVRVNRDDMRKMVYRDVPWQAHRDELIRKLEVAMVKTALKAGKTVIVDDTNCVARTRAMWEQVAREERVKVRRVRMTTPLDVCIERDAARPDGECVGKEIILRQLGDLGKADRDMTDTVNTRPVWERQLLLEGKWEVRLPGAKWVIVDVDGTLANHDGVRNQYDESRVLHDNPFPVVVEWVRALYPFYNVCIFSGRKTKAGDDTCDWFEMQGVPFDHVLMRHYKDNRKDAIVKKELLDDFVQSLGLYPKEDIAFILDDRPQVVRMWRDESEVEGARHGYGRLTVYPVRGAVEEF